MTILSLLKPVLLSCIAALLAIALGCGSDPVQPQLTETEKALTANTWHGVWLLKGVAFIPTILCEEVTFKSDKSFILKNCDSSGGHSWSITDSIGSSYLTMNNIRFLVEKLTADSLLLKETTSNGKSYLLLKNFKGYNRVKMIRTFENGTQGGTFGLECAEDAKPEIPEYNFSASSSPNPAYGSFRLHVDNGVNNASVKITIDDGQSQAETVFDDILKMGAYSISHDFNNKSSGVYRILYTVKPPDAQTSKTVYSYIFVSR